jgi:mono/diheme cytochrome c family protein
MTGMPAWEYRLSEADLWAVTAFVARLSQLAPAEWGRQLASLQAGACAVSAR